jgi:ketosteroid isomerase-like protein
MRRVTIVIVCLLAMLLPQTGSSAPAPPASLTAPVSRVVAVLNANDLSRLPSNYTANATIIDEFPPYVWTGRNAPVQWWRGFQQLTTKAHFSNVKTSMQPVQHYSVSGDKAYVVAPLVITYTANGKTQKETGLIACTLVRSGGLWKIATQSWATQTTTM